MVANRHHQLSSPSTRPLLCSGPAIHLAVNGGVFYFLLFDRNEFAMSLAAAKTPWQLTDETKAALQAGPFSARLDLTAPERGLASIQLHGEAVAARLLGVDLGRPPVQPSDVLVDSYLRGDDLVATYAQTGWRNVRPQLYWRATHYAEQQAHGIELIVSSQTSLLASQPAVRVTSEVTASEAFILHDCEEFTAVKSPHELRAEQSAEQPPAAWLFRLHGETWSYVEMIFPGDLETDSLSNESASRSLKHEMFSQGLEKGVIRRGRLLGLFLPRKHDQATAAKCYQRFVASPLPLTT